ncbi:MAG: class I SAM-dependent methyltransferase [Acidaminobacter sp.]|uniref:class I SAM-dependent methyltransferase n=1 Tax=Acidaminobacter sp. TaxID=1872102 RepID=UPI0013859BDD|nr:class I SAM-dependent methyltransferase [Acidaminobacter sp.]MZQ99470.1 class I SAM-dependent methyltransferase [Acidaminobacter sp.]
MQLIVDFNELDFESIQEDPYWSLGDEKELKVHRIHAYPAKFPSFITTKAIEYAKSHNLSINKIADVFCGCGTVAFESKRKGIDFWGCDINPVATMIAKTKSNTYKIDKLDMYFNNIISKFEKFSDDHYSYENLNDRLMYWYDQKNINELIKLKYSILNEVPSESKYQLFFKCAFSNILKPTSRWLTKSIKPQLDPNKNPADVIKSFRVQYEFMRSAIIESNLINESTTVIDNVNFLDESLTPPRVDMIVTSPPYVTSYEYADLHQLSTLWLDYIKDYRELRSGTIGSLYHEYNFESELNNLNKVGKEIVFELYKYDKSKAKSVAKYFLDMQKVAEKCYNVLSDTGFALFVIGNTEYKGVRIRNAEHLVASLNATGFNNTYVAKRKITGKILTPYRDEKGKFTNNKSSRKVYNEEFIVIGRK